MTEIQTFGFQTIGTKSPNDWNPNVRIPNSIALVPNVRNPNKTIPNSWSFGFQHCLKFERSVFGRWLYTNNFKIRILRKSGDLQISSWSLKKINYYILLVGTENFFKNPYPSLPPFYKLALNHNYRLIVSNVYYTHMLGLEGLRYVKKIKVWTCLNENFFGTNFWRFAFKKRQNSLAKKFLKLFIDRF